jgi:hypothetical protein
LGDELAAHFGGASTCIQALGAELGIGLALAIHEGADVIESMGEVDFSPLAPPSGKGIETEEATGEFMGAFAHGDTVPAQVTFGKALATWAECLDCARQKEPARAAFERLGRFAKQGFE